MMARVRPRTLRVLHVAAELYPWVKTGGLGDVVAALPPALLAQGIDARICVPAYPAFLDAFHLTDAVRLATPFAAERVRVALATLPGSKIVVYLVDHPPFYDRPGGPYSGPDGRDWPYNHRRFALLAWTAASGLIPLAVTFPMLVGVRGLVGVCEAVYYPAGTALSSSVATLASARRARGSAKQCRRSLLLLAHPRRFAADDLPGGNAWLQES